MYIDSSTGCDFFLGWPCVPTPNVHLDICDGVESYTIYMFLACRLRLIFMHKVELISFDLESHLSVLFILCTGSTTLLFKTPSQAKCSGHFEFQTVLLLSSAFCKVEIFLYQAIQPAVRAESVKARVKTKNFCSLQSFQSPRKWFCSYEFCWDLPTKDLCWVRHSRSTPKWVPTSLALSDWRKWSARKSSWAVSHPSRTPPQWI